ncbi:MAG: hypothetical protein GC137_09695 [Alphaproteobacteria bacterium]|nr:hypothetical protein [Alphaproteobacteria bacterium]
MIHSDTDFIKNVKNLENVVFVCFGRPMGEELPQVESERDIILAIAQEHTGQPIDFLRASGFKKEETDY